MPLQKGGSSWKPCPWRFRHSSSCLYPPALIPMAVGIKGPGLDSLPVASISVCCFTRVLMRHLWPAPKGHSSNKLLPLWKCSLLHRPWPRASDSYQRLKDRFYWDSYAQFEKPVHLPIQSTHTWGALQFLRKGQMFHINQDSRDRRGEVDRLRQFSQE